MPATMVVSTPIRSMIRSRSLTCASKSVRWSHPERCRGRWVWASMMPGDPSFRSRRCHSRSPSTAVPHGAVQSPAGPGRYARSGRPAWADSAFVASGDEGPVIDRYPAPDDGLRQRWMMYSMPQVAGQSRRGRSAAPIISYRSAGGIHQVRIDDGHQEPLARSMIFPFTPCHTRGRARVSGNSAGNRAISLRPPTILCQRRMPRRLR
jgi:hypothetical protein